MREAHLCNLRVAIRPACPTRLRRVAATAFPHIAHAAVRSGKPSHVSHCLGTHLATLLVMRVCAIRNCCNSHFVHVCVPEADAKDGKTPQCKIRILATRVAGMFHKPVRR